MTFILLTDLSKPLQTRAFTDFVTLYRAAFPASHEQQDPQEWLRAIQPGEPVTAILLAGYTSRARQRFRVLGGLVAEYYPKSQCGMFSYLVVDVLQRRRGIGRGLIAAAIELLIHTARSSSQELLAVFAEAEDFRSPDITEKGTMPQTRLIAHDRYGARLIDINYVMPRLGKTKCRDPNLLLLVFPDQKISLNATTVALTTVENFLTEYYSWESANPDDPRQEDEVARMRHEVEALAKAYHSEFGYPEPDRAWQDQSRNQLQVPLQAVPLPACAKLQLREVAVCLHFVTVDVMVGTSVETAKKHYNAPKLLGRVGHTLLNSSTTEYDCPIYHSFEMDILSYRFQDHPPIKSACSSETQYRVQVRFPNSIKFVAEGLKHELFMPDANLQARVSLSASRFAETGVRIWHLTFAPVTDAVFSEFDIVRLVALYYTEQEQTNLLQTVTFALGGGAEMLLPLFVDTLSNGQLKIGQPCGGSVNSQLKVRQPCAGTVEFNPAAGEPSDTVDLWKRILSALYLTTQDDQEGFRELEALYCQAKIEQMLNACCGIVSGHFDFASMSFAEMQDTLAPDSAAGSYAVWLNHATLANVDLFNEVLKRCGRTIGISPYLILPHAVLLHNEFVVDWAEEVARHAIEADDGFITVVSLSEQARTQLCQRHTQLADARRLVERCLYQAYIPDIFHYPGERELFEVGSRTRGALEKKETVESHYNDLSARLRDRLHELNEFDQRVKSSAETEETRTETQKEQRRSFLLTVLSVLLSLTVVLDVVAFFGVASNRTLLWPPNGWTYLLSGIIVLSLVALVFARPTFTRRRDD